MVNTEPQAPGQGGGKDYSATIQSLLGALVAGFAAILSFVGIKSAELTSILRNDEPRIPIVGIPFLLSIIVAIWSIFVGGEGVNYKWPTRRLAFVSLLVFTALFTLIPRYIQIPFVTTKAQTSTSVTLAQIILGSCALIWLILRFAPRISSWGKEPFNLQLYLILMSVLFLALSTYAAIRIESASQVSPYAQLDGHVTILSRHSAVLTLSISAAKVTVPDRVVVTISGLPRRVSAKKICKGEKTPRGGVACYVDPCFYRANRCRNLVGWDLPPDAGGGVHETLTLPFSPDMYQRLHIEDVLCEHATARSLCAKQSAGTHLDVGVPRRRPRAR